MSSDDSKARAEELKSEGNTYHLKGDHAAARSKYTEAIKLDGENAVLYANRAAAYIALKEYLDAAKDARKATELDPKYGKAWARLGKSSYELNLWETSIHAWKEALGTLPSADLSDQQRQVKAQFEEGLKLAEAALATFEERTTVEDNHMRHMPANVKPPWIVALEMEDVLSATNVLNSCAWPLMNAYKDFSEGVRYMKQLKRTPGGVEGNLNALQAIVGGLLRDERVFHMDAGWKDLQLQVEFELAGFGGWSEGGTETIKEEAVKLLKDKGWRTMRGALAATIRAWFLRAYFAERSGADIETAMLYYNNILDVLEWGTRVWHDIPSADRGHIFEKTYIRAIKRFRMNAYLKGLRLSVDESKYNEKGLIDMANQMVEETMKNVPKEGDGSPMDKGAWYSFFVFPVADAYASLGAVFLQRGVGAKKDGDAAEAAQMLAAAAKMYVKAAEMHPPDDEHFPYFLKIAFEAEWHRGRPLSETLPLCERARKALPAVMKIWKAGGAVDLTDTIRHLHRWETRAITGLMEERYTMETPSLVPRQPLFCDIVFVSPISCSIDASRSYVIVADL